MPDINVQSQAFLAHWYIPELIPIYGNQTGVYIQSSNTHSALPTVSPLNQRQQYNTLKSVMSIVPGA